MDEELELMLELKKGGQWLGAARRWMQSNIPRGDSLTWGSSELVQVPFGSLEEMARRVAVAAVLEDRRKRAR